MHHGSYKGKRFCLFPRGKTKFLIPGIPAHVMVGTKVTVVDSMYSIYSQWLEPTVSVR